MTFTSEHRSPRALDRAARKGLPRHDVARELRVKAGHTLADVAAATGCSITVAHSWEVGKWQPSRHFADAYKTFLRQCAAKIGHPYAAEN